MYIIYRYTQRGSDGATQLTLHSWAAHRERHCIPGLHMTGATQLAQQHVIRKGTRTGRPHMGMGHDITIDNQK